MSEREAVLVAVALVGWLVAGGAFLFWFSDVRYWRESADYWRERATRATEGA